MPTTEDFERLHRLSEQHAFGRNAELVEWLEIELARAEVVEPHAIPRDVVTVNSRVVFQDEETGVTGAALKHLQGIRSLETLKTKALPDADEGTRWIAGLTGLGELALPGSYERRGLTDTGVGPLAALANLRSLDLRCQQITDAGLAHLAGLSELEELDLSENRGIAGPGLEPLKGLPQLRRLKLDSTGLTDAAVPILEGFTRLEELGLWGTGIGERKLAAPRKALPAANP